MNELHLADRKIGNDNPCFVIAEAGVNHNGDVELAKRLVREAKKVGADCVKFQTFKAENVATANAPKAAYQLKMTDPHESQIAMLKKLELTESDHRVIMDECIRQQVIFLSTPYSLADAELLHELGVPGFKIASGQLVELPFLAAIARFNRPIVLSTGMATMDEVCEAVKTIRDNGDSPIAILQCTTNYPSRLEDANLRAMAAIREATGAIVGYSDHTEGINACLAAVPLGAAIIEKHFTINRDLPGPDHRCSSEPAEMQELVRGVREIERALGDGIKRPTAAELANLTGMRRSVVAAREIRAGERVHASDFAFKRPATGLAPKRLGEIVGRIARVDLAFDAQVQPADFD